MLSPVATLAPPARLAPLIEQAEALARETSLERTSLAFGHCLVRLYLASGRLEHAAAWLDRLRPHFGHVPAFATLETALAEARGAAQAASSSTGA
jgi:hypothetical protein